MLKIITGAFSIVSTLSLGAVVFSVVMEWESVFRLTLAVLLSTLVIEFFFILYTQE